MADAVFIPKPTRRQLEIAARGDVALLRAFEALFAGVQFAPEEIEAAQATADEALADAAAAQGTADAAVLAAQNAQDEVDTLELVEFITAAADPEAPNARVLDVGLGLTLTLGAPGTTATLDRSDLTAVLGVDVADSTAALVDATGLVISLVADATYMVDAALTFQSAAVTTGLALAFTLPAGATISGRYEHPLTNTTSEGSFNNASGAVGANTTGVPAATTNLPLTGRWVIKTAATAGDAQLQFRSEVAASAVTLKAGLSALIARRIA